MLNVFRKYLIPGEHLSFDESICSFKGRTLKKVFFKKNLLNGALSFI